MLFFSHPVFTVIENGTEHYHEQERKADDLQVRRSHLLLEHLLALVLSCLLFFFVKSHSVAQLQIFVDCRFLVTSFTVMVSRAALVPRHLGHSAECVASPGCIRLNPTSP